MASRKQIKVPYKWRLFIAMIALVWAIIGFMFHYQYSTQRNYKENMMRGELTMMYQRIIYNYENGIDIPEFVDMLGRYYDRSMFDEMQISVYNEHDSLIAAVGRPIPPSINSLEDLRKEQVDARLVKYSADGKNDFFYFSSCRSRDGRLLVLVGMPYTFSMARMFSVSSDWWLIVITVTIVATLIVLLSTRLFSRNIHLLRKFARQASSGEPLDENMKFPTDELGDISREIYEIYTARIKANERSEREHRVALHAIEEKSLIKRQMTNNINHEIKTPIGVIRGYLETILANPDMDKETRDHFLKRTFENVQRLCALLNDVSTMTRFDDGAESIPLAEIDMHDLIYGIANDLEMANIAPGMTFKYDVPLGCKVVGNHNLITGLVMNLIRNSAIHSHGTEMSFRLVSESSKFYIFSYADNGIGVGAEHIPHLFDRFYRVDAGRSRKSGGTGLGLPIVKSTVTSLGGSISVHNRSTGGLEFVFTLRKA